MAIEPTATDATARIPALRDDVEAAEDVEIPSQARAVAHATSAGGANVLEGALTGVALTTLINDDLFTTGMAWRIP